MIKLIISSPDLYTRLAKNTFLVRHVSFDFEKIDKINDEDTFYAMITDFRLPNGTYKTTMGNSFQDLDEKIISLLTPAKTYTIQELAASDGITSINLVNALTQRNIHFNITLSDKYSEFYCYRKTFLKYFADAEGNVSYADFFGIMLNKYLSNRFILSKLLGKLLKDKIDTAGKRTKFLLINPRTSELIKAGKINYITYDIFDPAAEKGSFDISRCMNLLNPRLFSNETLSTGIKNMLDSTKEDGLIIIGRTDRTSGKNNATIYRKSGNKINPVLHVNDGSEINDLVMKVNDRAVSMANQ